MNLIEVIKSWFRPPPVAAIEALSRPDRLWHKVTASSFADEADVIAFRKAKARGMTDMEAFRYGDNGVGWTGLDCTQENVPYCALPPDDWVARWGTKKSAGGRPVYVRINGKIIQGWLGDTMPAKKHIKNGAGIDLNPGFAKAFGLNPPFMVKAEWSWG